MKLEADLHVHTVSSGHAYSTLEEYVSQAKKIGLKAFAMTDHGPAMPGAPHYYHFLNMPMIPDEIDGVRIFKGVEANIINVEGELDLREESLRVLDVVMFAMHPKTGYDNQGEEENTRVLLKVLERYPQINVLAHPENAKYPINVEQTVAAAKAKGVALEINNSSHLTRPGTFQKIVAFAREIKKQEWKVVLGTDSHISMMLAKYDYALQVVKEAGLTEKHIINTSLKKVEEFLSAG